MKNLLISQIAPLVAISVVFIFNNKLELENKKLKDKVNLYEVQLKLEKNLYNLCDSERNSLKIK
jgi:hypothetical protein